MMQPPSLFASCSPDVHGDGEPPDYNEEFFRKWRVSLEDKLQDVLPINVCHCQLVEASKSVQTASNAKDEAQKKVDEISNKKPVDQAALEKAKKLLEEETQALEDALSVCQDKGKDELGRRVLQKFLSADFDDSDLVTWKVLQEGGDEQWAKWCRLGEKQTANVMNLLRNVDLMRSMLQFGGAKNGNYGPAVEIYAKLASNNSDKNEVLHRLALAVALELADPPRHFGTPDLVDPLLRYVHYEQAYLFGELDPAFERFGVWELRMVVDSNAPDEELGWGRRCLMDYRPDLVAWPDSRWRYCQVIHTDVAYRDIEWYKEPHSYDQILSSGGVCGPRAWYGRFICKAFGIPTWGVRQPGHAAMSRWTENGWMICLGAGWQYSFWDNSRCGLDFFLETQARASVATEEAYLRQVLRLEFMASFQKESDRSVRTKVMPDPSCPWWALSLMQRRILTSSDKGKHSRLMHARPEAACRPLPKIELLMSRTDDAREIIVHDDQTDMIIIPAASCTDPRESTGNVLFMKSFLGGQQLHLRDGAVVEYVLATDLLTPTAKQYGLSFRVCTVHRKGESLFVTVSNEGIANEYDDPPVSLLPVPLPFTVGMWQETEPVVVDIGGPNVSCTRISLFCKMPFGPGGVTVKDLKLIPL